MQTQEVGAVLLVVESDEAIGEEEAGVGQVGLVGRGVAALGLELVAEVADEAAVELEGEVGQVGGAEFGGAAVEVVEDRLVGRRALGESPPQRPPRVAHEREASPNPGRELSSQNAFSLSP